jgi:Zn-finger nucleic acid-binding protein
VVASRGPKSELHERPTMQCPCCNLPLEPEALGGEILDRCGQCGGEYVDSKALRRLLAALSISSPSRGSAYARPSPFSDPVRYRKCPACGELMLRKNFRESSGVVVDVCAAHGVWFDRGELAKVIEFASTGALAEADRRITARADAKRRLDAWGRDLRAAGPRHYVAGIRYGVAGPIDDLADIASLIPGLDADDD